MNAPSISRNWAKIEALLVIANKSKVIFNIFNDQFWLTPSYKTRVRGAIKVQRIKNGLLSDTRPKDPSISGVSLFNKRSKVWENLGKSIGDAKLHGR